MLVLLLPVAFFTIVLSAVQYSEIRSYHLDQHAHLVPILLAIMLAHIPAVVSGLLYMMSLERRGMHKRDGAGKRGWTRLFVFHMACEAVSVALLLAAGIAFFVFEDPPPTRDWGLRLKLGIIATLAATVIGDLIITVIFHAFHL